MAKVTDETPYGHYTIVGRASHGGFEMPPYVNEEMIWAHLAEVRRQARAAGWHPSLASTVERRPARAVLGELLVGIGLRLMAEPRPTPATARR
jgi:hypothetical protein